MTYDGTQHTMVLSIKYSRINRKSPRNGSKVREGGMDKGKWQSWRSKVSGKWIVRNKNGVGGMQRHIIYKDSISQSFIWIRDFVGT